MTMQRAHGTTVIGLIHKGMAAIAGDGQVTIHDTVIKNTAQKIRSLMDGKIIAGYAGTAGDALALFDLFEKKLELYNGNLQRSCIELVKDWRTDKSLQQLEAVIVVTDKKSIFLISGAGDVVEPDDKIVAIGSGGAFALAAARALIWANPKLSADKIAAKSIELASEICIFTNSRIQVESIR